MKFLSALGTLYQSNPSGTAAKAGSEINVLYNAKSILTDNSI